MGKSRAGRLLKQFRVGKALLIVGKGLLIRYFFGINYGRYTHGNASGL